ncbi:MAG: glycosyltransferase family 39 protein [Anaerolineae bacterium]|nr:glycosyltransferase family 39 protein [Anaerolineae bacterium]
MLSNHASRLTSHVSRLTLYLILLLHLALSLTYARTIPLGEAPDEPAHLSYAQFIARHGRLPTTLAERREAGYRSAWPPLYHFLVAGPLLVVGDAPPTRLKAVGDTPRRLIPTNGQTIAAFIHTADEAPPWRGLPLAWHLSRLISVALTLLSVCLTYAIARRLTGQRMLATAAAALHAFIPQVLFIGSVVNDDNLLIFLSGLIFLSLLTYPAHPSPRRAFLLGALLGLATVAKYNALPLWALTAIWTFQRKMRQKKTSNNYSPSSIFYPLSSILLFFLGSLLTAGWWFIFIWFNFNQIDSLGLLPGSLAALTAGTSDASLRQLSSVPALTFPALSAWLEWFTTLFETFWGSFGGGSTIDLPVWVYWLLALFCLLAIISRLTSYILRLSSLPSTTHDPLSSIFYLPSSSLPFLLSPLLFLPLPLLRFILSGSIIETAQGRHLFPALPLITLALVWGVSSVKCQVSSVKYQVSGIRRHILRFKFYVLHLIPSFTIHHSPFTIHHLFPFLTFCLSLYSLSLIQNSYPPPIPLRTTAEAATAASLVQAKVAKSITLIGYEVGQAVPGILPLTLVWQADATPPDDYLIELTVTGADGQPLGGWLGHPLGGRYPTRAWDKGDILRHTIPVPVLPAPSTTPATLTLRLLDSSNQPTLPTPLTLNSNLPSLPPAPLLPRTPADLRADALPPNSPFTYRSTLSFVLPDPSPPELIAPTGQAFSPTQVISTANGSIAHFIVAADWPSGEYQLPIINNQLSIVNRLRQFDLPSVQHLLNANFADTLTLLGYDLPQNRAQPGAAFPITLHWRAERPIGRNLIVFNHLLDANAIQRGGADRVPQLYYTTLLWVPGEIVTDAYDVPVAADAPPGVYWLDAGLYPSDQPTFSLPLFEQGQPVDRNSVRLGPLKIGGPPPGVTVPAANPQNPLNLSFGNQITLLGFTMTRDEDQIVNRKSKIVNLKLYWRADSPPSTDYTVFIHLLDSTGKLIAQFDQPPAAGAYPTHLWDPGEIIADEHHLTDLPAGRYTLHIGLYNPATGERLAVAGSPEGVVRLAEIEVED